MICRFTEGMDRLLQLLCNVLNLLAATVWTCDRESLLDLSGMSTLPNMHRQSTCVYFQVLMWMAGDILRWNGSGQYIQGVFFNWCSPKIPKYGEKLMYQNWCPPKIHKYGENRPPKSAIGIPLRYQPPQSVLKMWGLVHWTTIATYSSTLKLLYKRIFSSFVLRPF